MLEFLIDYFDVLILLCFDRCFFGYFCSFYISNATFYGYLKFGILYFELNFLHFKLDVLYYELNVLNFK